MVFQREQFILVRENQQRMLRINQLASKEVQSLLRVSKDFTVDETGGFLRKVIPTVTSRYGGLQQASAITHYKDMRELAQAAGDFTPIAPKLDEVAKTAGIIDYAMSLKYADSFDAMTTNLQNEITRAIASYNRDTISYNGALDSTVVSVQRVAEANACAFCTERALDSYNYTTASKGAAFTSSVAVDYHNFCNCTIETIYEGQEAIQPDYYTQMQEEYSTAEKALYEESLKKAEELGTVRNRAFLKEFPEYSATTKNIARVMREQTGRA